MSLASWTLMSHMGYCPWDIIVVVQNGVNWSLRLRIHDEAPLKIMGIGRLWELGTLMGIQRLGHA